MSGISGRLLGVFRHEQRGCQKLDFDDLCFVASGARRFAVNGWAVDPLPPSFFFLAARGSAVEFEFGPDRRNWVLSLSGMEMRLSHDPRMIDVGREDLWISLPMVTPVACERVSGWCLELERLGEAQQDPVPRNLWRVELGVQRILAAIFDSDALHPPLGSTPASRLKAWLDADRGFSRNLEDVCAEFGYSAYHLRELFGRAYGLGPQAYRSRRRMALAMDWITGTEIPLKEIAARLGFRHFSHFSVSFSRAFGVSPRDALRRYRFGPHGEGSA